MKWNVRSSVVLVALVSVLPMSVAETSTPAMQTVSYADSDENVANPERGTVILFQPAASNGHVENVPPLGSEGAMNYFNRERARTGATTIRVVYVLADWITTTSRTSFSLGSTTTLAQLVPTDSNSSRTSSTRG